MKRLDLESWRNIIRNSNEEGEEVEIVWLDGDDSDDEYVLCYECELFEDGFKDEYEADRRLQHILKEVDKINSKLNESSVDN